MYRKQRGRSDGDPTFDNTGEAVEFTRMLARIEGGTTPELDALMAGGKKAAGLRTADPLANVAWEYALAVSMWLVAARADFHRERAVPPSPEEIVVWYHLRIYMKLVRAIIARERTESGACDRTEDMNGCAKLTLVSLTRSREALRRLETPSTRRTVASLIALLDAVEAGIHERFPGARTFIRLGLDVPVV